MADKSLEVCIVGIAAGKKKKKLEIYLLSFKRIKFEVTLPGDSDQEEKD